MNWFLLNFKKMIFFFGCAYGELKAKRFTYFDDSMKKKKVSTNILDVFFFYECAVLPMRAKNTPKSLEYDLALEVDEGYMSLHVDFSLAIV
jgi:hypothetical protein